MKHRGVIVIGVFIVAVVFGSGRRDDDSNEHQDADAAAPVRFTEDEIRQILTLSPLPELPTDSTNRVADNADAALLGQTLFFDTALSANRDVSCATCHIPEQHFTDGKPQAEGALPGVRNTPTLLNTVFQRWYFWDGRADSLWGQTLSPLENPIEMDGDRLSIALYIRGDIALNRSYVQVFGALPELPSKEELPDHAKPMPDDPDHPMHRAWSAMSDDHRAAVNTVFVNVGKAIAAYERKLVTGPSPFDQFAAALRTDDRSAHQLISPAAQRGLKLFIGKAGCRDCHNGPLLTDFEFHSVGVPPLEGLPADSGRFGGVESLHQSTWRADGPFSGDASSPAATRTRSLIRSPETWGQFRTPSLRNVALTAPYMHQGQYATLEDVLEHYSTLDDAVDLGHHQEQVLQPLNLKKHEFADLKSFLESLTGTPPPGSLLQPPRLTAESGN